MATHTDTPATKDNPWLALTDKEWLALKDKLLPMIVDVLPVLTALADNYGTELDPELEAELEADRAEREAELAEITTRTAMSSRLLSKATIEAEIADLKDRIKGEDQAEYDARRSREDWEAEIRGYESVMAFRKAEIRRRGTEAERAERAARAQREAELAAEDGNG